MSKKLKAKDCPFCGSKAELCSNQNCTVSWVACSSCEARGFSSYFVQTAFDRWNMRFDKKSKKIIE